MAKKEKQNYRKEEKLHYAKYWILNNWWKKTTYVIGWIWITAFLLSLVLLAYGTYEDIR